MYYVISQIGEDLYGVLDTSNFDVRYLSALDISKLDKLKGFSNGSVNLEDGSNGLKAFLAKSKIFGLKLEQSVIKQGYVTTCLDADFNQVSIYTLPFGIKRVTSMHTHNAIKTANNNDFILTHASLPSSIRHLGNRCFEHLINMSEIHLPPYTESIGDEAFKGCNSLNVLSIPRATMFVGGDILKGCNNLRKLIIPKELKYRFERYSSILSTF